MYHEPSQYPMVCDIGIPRWAPTPRIQASVTSRPTANRPSARSKSARFVATWVNTPTVFTTWLTRLARGRAAADQALQSEMVPAFRSSVTT